MILLCTLVVPFFLFLLLFLIERVESAGLNAYSFVFLSLLFQVLISEVKVLISLVHILLKELQPKL